MAIGKINRKIHLDYFLSMEEDLLRLSRFVDFSGNDETYSIEIVRLLMAACAEVDVVLKEICRVAQPGNRARSINAYRPIVLGVHPSLRDVEVRLDRFGLLLHPWSDWSDTDSPRWWTANNKVKHERLGRSGEGNLKNCLNAVAGLFAAVLYMYREEAETGGLHPGPALLRAGVVLRGNSGIEPQLFYYRLP